VIFHVIANKETHQGRKLSAYDLFSSCPEQFSALLENPSGMGKQFLVSKQGDMRSLSQRASSDCAAHFFAEWKSALQSGRQDSPAIRCLIYAAYEAGALIESMPEAKSAVAGPVLWTLYPEFSLCFESQYIHIAAADDQTLQHVLRLLDAVVIAAPSHRNDHPKQHQRQDKNKQTQPVSSMRKAIVAGEDYQCAVQQVKDYIAAGDVFQANIARFWAMPFTVSELLALYARLRDVNAAPFAAFVDIETEHDRLYILSSSPERLFRLHADGAVDTRPIAGTRRRADGDQDEALRQEMLLSEKERAEHIMLVDLERNDLGRVCCPGSVEVNERMVVEQYATVQHIVSNVRGQLDADYDVVDLFKAMFPGGTITGCPKVRCMEIIHELENNARSAYTGGLGYVAWDGSADMNILIRTFWHHADQLHWAAGAGIVADSDPEHELTETEHKVEGLLRAFDFKAD